MNNPFGLPDEVMNAVIAKALKTQLAREKAAPGDKPTFDPATAAKKSASTAKQLMDAYTEAGFTNEQAFELVKGILTARKN